MGKVSCLMTNNGSNIKAAARNLRWPWWSSFGDNLNLAVSNTVNKTVVSILNHWHVFSQLEKERGAWPSRALASDGKFIIRYSSGILMKDSFFIVVLCV